MLIRIDFYKSFMLIKIYRDIGIDYVDDKILKIDLSIEDPWNFPKSTDEYERRLDTWFSSIVVTMLDFNMIIIDRNTRQFEKICFSSF